MKKRLKTSQFDPRMSQKGSFLTLGLIRSELSKPGENLTNIYIKLRAECTFHKNNIIEKQSQQQVRKEQAKQPIKQLEKDFDGPCL